MSLVLLFVGGLTKRHYYVSSLVVCRRTHKETLLCLQSCCLQEGSQRDTIMPLVQLFVGGLTKRHYYASSLVVCRRAHKETLLYLQFSCLQEGSQGDISMSLVVCRGADTIISLIQLFVGGLTKRHYYASGCLQEGSQRDTIMPLVVCRRAHVLSMLFVFVYVQSNTYCAVFLFCFFFVLFNLCCQFL